MKINPQRLNPDDQAESAGGYTEQTQEKNEENELR
jgi:hypothetical protein